jgi:hypothetical protein
MNYICHDCNSDFDENEVACMKNGTFVCIECCIKSHSTDELGITGHHANIFFNALSKAMINGSAAGRRLAGSMKP